MSADEMNAGTKPTAISSARAPCSSWRASKKSCANAAAIVGIARKNENSAAAARSTRSSIAATIVPPDRDTPGTSASVCPSPTTNARPIGIRSASRTSGCGRTRSTIRITMPPAMKATAMIVRLPCSTVLTNFENSAPATSSGITATMTAIAKFRASASEPRLMTTRTIFSRYSHMTAKIDPSWIIVVNTPPGSSKPSRRLPISRCAVDDTGRNSVTPWMTPRMAALASDGKGGASALGGSGLPLRLLLALRLLRRRRGRRHHVRVRRGARRRVAAPEADDRRRDEDARVGAGDDADHHREREAVQDLAAEEEQRERRQQRRARRDHRPAERLVHRDVDDVVHRVAAHDPQVLADPVEDDDRVVGREARHRENRGDHVQRHVVAEEREERERDQQAVDRRADRADAEAELEAEREVREDADQREHRRPNTLARQLAPDRGADDLGALPRRVEARLLERTLDLVRLDAERRAGFGADLRHADHQQVRGRIAGRLHDGVLAAAHVVLVERLADLLDADRLIELLDHDGAARELHALAQPARPDRDDAGDDDDPRQRDRVPPPR